MGLSKRRRQRRSLNCGSAVAALLIAASAAQADEQAAAVTAALQRQLQTIVVIYAENRSFDNLYGAFPHANGLQHVTAAQYQQRDRDGSGLKELPPIWGGLTAKGVTPPITEAQTAQMWAVKAVTWR